MKYIKLTNLKSQKEDISLQQHQDMDDTGYGETSYQFDYIHALERNYVVNSKLYLFGTLRIFKRASKYMNVILTHTIHFVKQ
jgi:hypothetical protein